MKRFLTSFLLLCTCACITAAVGCSCKDKQTDPTMRTVTFSTGEGYTFYSNATAEGTVAEGSQLIFEVELGAFYAGNLTAYVNEEIVNPDTDGVYSYTVGAEDLSVRVEGVRKDVSSMMGSGSLEDAFVVSRPIDLVYIAEQVNKGNTDYSNAAYVLANDIDCKGEELQIIGDYSSESAVFHGSFASGTDPETGKRERYAISNFTINSTDSNYVGLFGAVINDMRVQSSGLFYGVRLENFTISASANDIQEDNKSISCGGLVGYAVGANFYLCGAENGELNVVSDNNYFSFVGGLVGYQQGFYNAAYDMYNASDISYTSVDVDVNILGGVSLYAGGIVGFATTNYPYNATAAIHNSYATGSVSGALRSGGIVGGLGRYTVVSNCYATGEITARSYQPKDSLLITSDEYCHAYAGGIAGYAENDTIANDCFFNGSVSASTASDNLASGYSHADNAIAGGDGEGVTAVDGKQYVAHNCLTNVDLASSNVLTEDLGWGTYNWTFKDGALPSINYAEHEGSLSLSLTLKYLVPGSSTTVKVNGKTETTWKFFDTSVQSLNNYYPLGTFMYSGSLNPYYQADDSALRSYGYFFDEACTIPAPVSYMPMRDVTLYVGFTDPTPIAKEYKLLSNTNTDDLSLTINADGTATYNDGATKLEATYGYDGKRIVLEGVRLARYYDGKIVIDEQDTTSFQDENFDMARYDFYNFVAMPQTDGSLKLYDGVYFTAENPLIARTNALRGERYTADGTQYFFYGDRALVKDNSGEKEYGVVLEGTSVKLTSGGSVVKTIAQSDLKEYDAFRGTWVKSATVNKIYVFDGMGGWEYKQISHERSLSGYMLSVNEVESNKANGSYVDGTSGSYSADSTSVKFTHDGQEYTASIQGGFLQIVGAETQIYSIENSYKGRWKGNGFDLVLEGIRTQGYGNASIIDKDGFTTKLLYEVSETGSVIALYTILDDGESTPSKNYLYGYASYSLVSNTLSFVSQDTSVQSGYSTSTLYLYDDYYGEWVCEHENLKGVNLDFNGLGLYSYLGNNSLSGILTITDGDTVTKVEYQLETALIGKFSYKNKTYQLTFNENSGSIHVEIVSADDTTLVRKDEFAGLKLISKEGEKCDVDGRSTLSTGGTLTFDGTTYRYFAKAGGGYDVKALNEDTVVGSIMKVDNHYTLAFNGGSSTDLYVENKFMGDWAISGQYALFKIGPTDLDGVVQANYKGKDVELKYLDPATLTFKYTENKMPYTYYVYVVHDDLTGTDALVVSEFTNLAAGDYLICSKANELYGTWEWNDDGGKTTLRFDGVTSSYANGLAELTLTLNNTSITTEYYYSIRKTGIVLWSREAMAGRTWYYRLELVDASQASNPEAFVLKGGNKVLLRTEVDGLYLTEATDEDGNRYIFDGLGKMKLMVNGVPTTAKYEYTIKSYNDNRTATLEVIDLATKIKYSATLDYSDSNNVKFILGAQI